MQEWHCHSGGQHRGPLSIGDLRQLVQQGRLRPTDMVWRDGQGEMQMASAVAELADLIKNLKPVMHGGGESRRVFSKARPIAWLVIGTMGFFFCGFGAVGWWLAQRDLDSMESGLVSPAGRELFMVARAMGVIWSLLGLVVLGALFVLSGFSVFAKIMS